MKIEKAIEILESELQYMEPPLPQGTADALKLGIEALKKLKEARLYKLPSSAVPLLGEEI